MGVQRTSELASQLFLGAARGQSDDLVAHLVRELESEMAETAETLDCNDISRRDVHVAERV